MKTEFNRLFDDMIQLYMRRHPGITLEAVARLTGYSASGLRFFRKDRTPHRDALLRMVRGLEMTDIEVNQLLSAAHYEPLQEHELVGLKVARRMQEPMRSQAAKILEFPDDDAMSELIGGEMDFFVAAWEGYLTVRADLYKRNWSEVSAQIDQGFREWFRPVRRQSARYYGYLSLLKVAADEYRGAFDEALRTARAALHAADVAADEMLTCRCHVRLGDIYKLIGRFQSATFHYDLAKQTVAGWTDRTPAQDVWARLWQARADRKIATMYLMWGQTKDAEKLLLASIREFERLGSLYERSRAAYNLGWAYSDLGRYEDARDSHAQGLDLTKTLAQNRDWEDPRQLFEGYVSLGSDYLHLGDYRLARENLDRALWLVEPTEVDEETQKRAENLASFHEVGRLYLLLGKLHHYSDQFHDLEQAEVYLRQAEAYHAQRKVSDPARMASIYNALGLLYLTKARDVDTVLDALDYFDSGLDWAGKSEPPVLFYQAACLVSKCAAYLRAHVWNDDTKGEAEAIASQAEQLCQQGEFWDHYARLGIIWATHYAALEEWTEMTSHAVQALIRARKFNLLLRDRTCREIATLLSSLPARDRRRVISDIEDGIKQHMSVQGDDLELRVALARLQAPVTP